MLSPLAVITRRARRDERGMTLVELLVAIVAGIIVTAALYAILTTTLRQTSRVFSRVDATQRSRLAMENIESLLHSSCLAESTTPIWSNTNASIGPTLQSTGTTLNFVSKYGGAATLTPLLHSIALNTTTKKLVDTTYASTGGTAPNWTFSATPSATNTMLTNVTQSGSTPAFQYFAYVPAKDSSGNAYQDDAGNPYQMLLDGTNSLPSGTFTSTGTAVAAGTVPANSPSPLPVPLSATNVDAAAEVMITLKVGPDSANGLNSNLSDVAATVTNAVVLRLTPVVSDGTDNQEVSPCA